MRKGLFSKGVGSGFQYKIIIPLIFVILFSACVYLPNIAHAALTDNLVSFWNLNEASGTRTDSVGSNNLTSNNSVGQSVGKVGNAAHFTAASNQYLSIADNASVSMGPGVRFTFTGWIYLDSSTGTNVHTIVSKRKTISSPLYEYTIFYYAGDGKVSFKASPNGTGPSEVTVQSSTTLSTGAWYFVAAWYDGSNLNISINNGPTASAPYTADVFDGTNTFTMGSQSDPTYYHNGRLDAVGFWKRALTSEERTQLYNSGNGLEYPFSGTAPTVTTQVASAVATTTATGNGNITDIGSEPPSIRGFNYGLTTSYGATTSESGSFPTGAFTGLISGLTCDTPYHIRAYATNSGGTGVGEDQTFITSACPNTIAIISPVAFQVFQRNGSNQANVTIAGTYTGTPTAIEASWNGSPYTTIVTNPTGGTFSGTLPDQIAGQGTLSVRFTNDESASASKSYVGVGDIFVIAGQSNASGRGTSNQTYSHATLKAVEFGNDDNWKELVDPVDSSTNQVDAVSNDGCGICGSVWPLVATLYLADQNVPVAFIPTAMGGTAIEAWQPNPGNHGLVTTLYGSMYRRITAVGGSVKAVLFWQGESDALNGISQATYKAKLVAMADAIYSDFGVKTIVAQIGEANPATAANLDNVRLAQQSAWNDNGNVLAGPAFYDVDVDPYHFETNPELQLAANRWWAATQKDLYAGADGRGPILFSAEHNPPKTQITLTFTDETLPLLPTSGLTGLTVNDNGTPVSISSTSRIASNKLRTILVSPAVGSITISLGTGRSAKGATVPTDSSTYNLPAEIFVDHATTVLDEIVPIINDISSDKANGSYTTGEIIDVDVTFSEAVTSTGDVTITLETGITDRTCVFTISNSATGTCNYIVQAGDTSVDLTVNTISGVIADQAGNLMTNFIPVTNLAVNKSLLVDTTAPVCSLGSPSGHQSVGTTQVTLFLATDEASTCKYGTLANTPYDSIATTFTTTGGMAHSSTISGLSDGQSYNYHVRCVDGLNNVNSDDYTISFSIASPTSSGGGGGSGFYAPYPMVPVGGFTVTGETTNAQNRTVLHFGFGNDITTIAISDNINFAPATYIHATSSVEWTATTTKMLYIKYCNRHSRCSSPISVQISAYVPVVSSSYQFYKNLSYRMTNSDVRELQKYLNANGFIVAPSGAGSIGKETNYFGRLTYQALIKFQEAHVADILTPNGLTSGTGYFGPSTRLFVNK